MQKVIASIIVMLFTVGVCTARQGTGIAATNTTIALSIFPKAGILTAGETVTLTASVSRGGAPLTRGLVLFCDASAPSCQDLAIFGKAQLNNNGIATVKLTLGAGIYEIKAVFRGTPHSNPPASSSTSTTESVTVNGSSVSR